MDKIVTGKKKKMWKKDHKLKPKKRANFVKNTKMGKNKWEKNGKKLPMVTKIGINWNVNKQAKNNPIENLATVVTVLLNSYPQKGQISSKLEASK